MGQWFVDDVMINASSALIAYTYKKKRQSLNIRVNDLGLPAIIT